MLGIVIVNFNTSQLTLACLKSLADTNPPDLLRVIIVDNASRVDERTLLVDGMRATFPAERLQLERNIGFAGACNHATRILLADADIRHVMLLNNDAVVLAGGVTPLLEAAGVTAPMIAGRMHRFDAPDSVDSLGIAMYSSALASNRMDLRDRLVGPTGGLALYSRRLLEALQAQHGMIFDERFFCYAEDTDLALRARLLGFECAYVDERIALHHGQASSGGGFSDFVLYHGIRNSIWVLVKDFPMVWLLLLSPLIVVLHVGIVLRHGLQGRWRVVWRLYRDAFRGIPAMWRSRRVVQASRVLSLRGFGRLLTPRFYDGAFLRKAWRELWRGPRGGASADS